MTLKRDVRDSYEPASLDTTIPRKIFLTGNFFFSADLIFHTLIIRKMSERSNSPIQ